MRVGLERHTPRHHCCVATSEDAEGRRRALGVHSTRHIAMGVHMERGSNTLNASPIVPQPQPLPLLIFSYLLCLLCLLVTSSAAFASSASFASSALLCLLCLFCLLCLLYLASSASPPLSPRASSSTPPPPPPGPASATPQPSPPGAASATWGHLKSESSL